ncbi:hypothetical protein MTCD1_03274 [Colwellia marinimaniae]|uniref:Transposase n=1 Tax=Colwellia marinimaniae TaxID=1513592 RepID=A0ABQ0MZ44_9GAMM|nr:hypothetical protein MTCD1_03274 [Colwellia marinimaniae]
MDYQRYSSQFKEAILNKLSQSGLSVRKFAEQEGINISTMYSWQKQFNVSGFSVSKVSSSDKWSSEEKFAVVIETSTLSEVDLSEYCRTKGLYPEQIKVWKQAFIAGSTAKSTKKTKSTPGAKSR